MGFNTKNHHCKGGDCMCIGGELRVVRDGKLILEEGAAVEDHAGLLGGGSGGGCLVLTSDWATDGANGETTANMTFAEAYALLMNGAPTVYRQDYGYDMHLYSSTDVKCSSDRIFITVYAGGEWLLDVTFKSDGTIEIPMDG